MAKRDEMYAALDYIPLGFAFDQATNEFKEFGIIRHGSVVWVGCWRSHRRLSLIKPETWSEDGPRKAAELTLRFIRREFGATAVDLVLDARSAIDLDESGLSRWWPFRWSKRRGRSCAPTLK